MRFPLLASIPLLPLLPPFPLFLPHFRSSSRLQAPLTSLRSTANRKELVTDFLRKAKQLEFLIEALPSLASGGEGGEEMAANGMKEDEEESEELEREMSEVNREYEEALGEAGACFFFSPFSSLPSLPHLKHFFRLNESLTSHRPETLHRQLETSLRGVLETRSNPAAVAAAAATA